MKLEDYQHLEIKVGALGDPPLFLDHQPCNEASILGLGILEAGTVRGRVSVALMILSPSGEKLMVQMTARTFLAAAGCVRGAVERFGDPE